MADVDETIIGEGVALDTAAASLGSRAASSLLDAVIVGSVYFGTVVALAAVIPPSLDTAALAAIFLIHALAIFIGAPILVETLTRGRSVGKLALGLRIVRDDGGPITFRHAFIRALVGIVELWAASGGIALIVCAATARGKRVGDVIAGTYALQTRASKMQHLQLVVPYSLSQWAASVDIRRLPDGLALEARQFLTRATSLHEGSRRGMGEDLARRFAPYVSPLPPAGTHPETFMTAALAVRRDREYAIEVRRLRADAEQALAVHRLPHSVPEAV